ncbi:unnamed protein product [Brassica rapa]|uniref:Uncharacterized protein n=1 Tax=Brassica campestris TaxID=3711 RepID=A0A8D9LMZ9_BRACM|nr:unnamed protein product [Brassica rapa]
MQGRARTETEKTFAFGIPVIDKIIKFNTKHGHGKTPISFILTPTKYLDRQVAKFKEAPSLGGALNRTLSNPLVTSTTCIHVSGTQELVL